MALSLFPSLVKIDLKAQSQDPTGRGGGGGEFFLLDVCSDFVLKSIPNRFRGAGPQSVAGLL
jgi:hypothetical protein